MGQLSLGVQAGEASEGADAQLGKLFAKHSTPVHEAGSAEDAEVERALEAMSLAGLSFTPVEEAEEAAVEAEAVEAAVEVAALPYGVAISRKAGGGGYSIQISRKSQRYKVRFVSTKAGGTAVKVASVAGQAAAAAD